MVLPIAIICGALVATAAHGFQWPVDDLAVTATFGENRWNHFHGGIDIGGGRQDIKPIDDGEVIYYHEEGRPHSPVPTGLGNFLVVEHARGIRSLYAHLEPGTIDADQVLVTKDDVLGETGESGSSLGRHLHFEVSDREFHQLVNPVRLLPELPDISAPVIGKALLVQAGAVSDVDASRIDLEAVTTIGPGSWRMLLEVYDVSGYVEYFCPMAPYQVQVYLNGEKKLSIVFDGIGEVGDRLELAQSKGATFSSFYLDEWLFDAGTLSIPEGGVKIEIVASDYSGNESNRRISLTSTRK
jgi:hypothetical protein